MASPVRELRTLGVVLEEEPDFIQIEPPALAAPPLPARRTGVSKRIAMCFWHAGLDAAGLQILDPTCLANTYANYWRDRQRCRPGVRHSAGAHSPFE